MNCAINKNNEHCKNFVSNKYFFDYFILIFFVGIFYTICIDN